MRYKQLCEYIKQFRSIGLTTGSIGCSVMGRELYFVKVGNGGRNIIIQASIHAREYCTTTIAIKQIEHLINYNLGEYTLYFIPMLNPDGVEMCHDSVDFNNLKANANFVDLNTNFDAHWGQGAQNQQKAGLANYIGKYPHDQPETESIVQFTKKLSPVSTMSYHSRGRELYWDFFAPYFDMRRDKEIALVLASYLQYKVVSSQNSSAGGYKDWCIQQFKIPSFTVEFMPEFYSYPIPQEAVLQEFNLSKNLPLILINCLS
ncbi:MAG: hypothetical protein LBU60_03015 [Clostridiales bacterium]|jgi:g-D-glutamyl-meso-diaminopimelate peptidase|nr:hypothetical protein [Clostridiales bacterium]